MLVFTPTDFLFVPVGESNASPKCDGVGSVSAFCLVEGGRQEIAWLLALGLLVVASGFLPRYTSVLHFWISLSVAQSIALPDGGEAAAQVVTFFIMIASANDRRLFHWTSGSGSMNHSRWQGVSWAGSWGLRLQVAFIYLNSSLTKLSTDTWQDGSATYYVSRMVSFGASEPLADLYRDSMAISFVALATSWGTIAIEAIVALLIVRGKWAHPFALGLSSALHLGIMWQLGIFSFALIMLGAVLCSTASGVERLLARRGRFWRGDRLADIRKRLPLKRASAVNS